MSDDHVADEELLYRRVRLLPGLFVEADGKVRPSSQAFNDRYRRPSVDRANLRGGDPTKSQIEESDSIVSLVAQDIRDIKTVEQRNEKGEVIHRYMIDVEPKPEPDNPAHAEIFAVPEFSSEGAFRRLKERLAQLAV